VANSVSARFFSSRWRAIATASARPSKVEVPRPISSISTRLWSVAPCRMAAASVISTMKVERPEARSSEAPMRVKMASTGPIGGVRRHEAADVGEQHDQRHLAHGGGFAAHVGAGDQQHAAGGGSRRQSLAMKFSTWRSTTGWRPPTISMPGCR
jgi:hypothetical protein